MKKCKYCDRYNKNRVTNCMSCGSDKFSEIEADKIVVIDAPKEGFHVNTERLEKQKKKYRKYWILGLCTFPFYLIGIIGLWYPFALGVYFFVAAQFIFVTLGLIIGGMICESNCNKKLKKIEYLKYHGKLVKNQHYRVKNLMNNYFTCTVSFRMSDQDKAIPLQSERVFATELFYDDGLVDVLIDPEQLGNYYISFDIC